MMEMHTSYYWQQKYPEIEILNPDGWDRNKYQFSWFEEEISLEEYVQRLMKSTIYVHSNSLFHEFCLYLAQEEEKNKS